MTEAVTSKEHQVQMQADEAQGKSASIVGYGSKTGHSATSNNY